jgi:hypothetical protein
VICIAPPSLLLRSFMPTLAIAIKCAHMGLQMVESVIIGVLITSYVLLLASDCKSNSGIWDDTTMVRLFVQCAIRYSGPTYFRTDCCLHLCCACNYCFKFDSCFVPGARLLLWKTHSVTIGDGVWCLVELMCLPDVSAPNTDHFIFEIIMRCMFLRVRVTKFIRGTGWRR